MDKGFFSAKNIDCLLHADHPIHFLISVPFTSAFAKKQVESERKDIDRPANTILTGDGVIRGVHKIRSWEKRSDKLHTFVYFNPEKQIAYTGAKVQRDRSGWCIVSGEMVRYFRADGAWRPLAWCSEPPC